MGVFVYVWECPVLNNSSITYVLYERMRLLLVSIRRAVCISVLYSFFGFVFVSLIPKSLLFVCLFSPKCSGIPFKLCLFFTDPESPLFRNVDIWRQYQFHYYLKLRIVNSQYIYWSWLNESEYQSVNNWNVST